jgi:hypothetical protein
VDGIILGGRKQGNNVADLLKGSGNLTSNKELAALLLRQDVSPKDILRQLRESNIAGAELDEVLSSVIKHKNIHEKELLEEIAEIRKSSGIKKTRNLEGQIEGGTVGAGKVDLKNPGKNIPEEKVFSGASPEGQVKGGGDKAIHHDRYKSPQADVRSQNHAEQNILGGMADDILEQFPDLKKVSKNIPKPDINGNVHLVVDQAVCSACRQGLESTVDAGIIKQFSKEFPDLVLHITAIGSKEIMVVKNGVRLL